ncbi:MAG: hypothetical protein PHD61_13250 [Bacteroidales bacterium]|nr:hypothetical protein [Lentimicrobiaceae bacterium]MDD5696254.1 hypothetical protein [Bacteroidales bacterium]
MTSQPEPECCPKFDPTPWDDKVFEWKDKKFIKDRVCTVFYMPLNFGCVMRRMDKKIRASGAALMDGMCLSEHTSGWNMNVYLAVDKDVAGIREKVISGKFYSRVYEGPFKNTRKWIVDFEEIAKSKNFHLKKWYMWYTTCPKCAKKYGKNYVVIIAQID